MIVLFGLDEFGQRIGGLVDGAEIVGPLNKRHDRAEANIAAAFAFAGALAGRTAQGGQQAAADVRGGIGQLRGALAGFGAGNIAGCCR